MRLNTIIEEDYGKGDCNYRSAPSASLTPLAAPFTTGGDGEIIASEPRGGALRINHAHDEALGMGDHPSCH